MTNFDYETIRNVDWATQAEHTHLANQTISAGSGHTETIALGIWPATVVSVYVNVSPAEQVDNVWTVRLEGVDGGTSTANRVHTETATGDHGVHDVDFEMTLDGRTINGGDDFDTDADGESEAAELQIVVFNNTANSHDYHINAHVYFVREDRQYGPDVLGDENLGALTGAGGPDLPEGTEAFDRSTT